MAEPRLCCSVCVGDRHIRTQVFPFRSKVTGTCAYCGTQEQALLEPRELAELFASVVGIYEPDEEGRLLGEWFKEDWAMFDHAAMDDAHVKDLLGDILDDGDAVRRPVAPVAPSDSESLAKWDPLCEELKHQNRFFPDSDIDLDRLRELLDHLLLSPAEVPATWYRGRIQRGDRPFPAGKMGAPPQELATHGRANPAGIPYLYLASAPTTAIAELRPHTGEFVTIATVEVATDRKILDLAAPRKTVSPFVLSGTTAVAQLRADIGFLEQLGEELTRPVLPTAAAVDYTPSQYLCEFVKKCGFDGVRYASAVGEDLNLALFNPADGTILATRSHKVTKVSVEHDEA